MPYNLKYALDWSKCSSILWFREMLLRIQDTKILFFSRFVLLFCPLTLWFKMICLFSCNLAFAWKSQWSQLNCFRDVNHSYVSSITVCSNSFEGLPFFSWSQLLLSKRLLQSHLNFLYQKLDDVLSLPI